MGTKKRPVAKLDERIKLSNIAIFDLDYTLTKRGTWGRFVVLNVRTRPWLWVPLLVSAAWHQWQYKRGKIERIRVKEAMMRWGMAGKSRAQIEALATHFAQKEVYAKFRPGAIRALKQHEKAGDTLIIASAAVNVIVEAICKEMSIQHWVATEMNWEGGKLSRCFKSKNCYGPEKLKAVKCLLSENSALKHSDTLITFYSDSHSDIDMFHYCDIGFAINPNTKLRVLAPSLGIEIIDWNT